MAGTCSSIGRIRFSVCDVGIESTVIGIDCEKQQVRSWRGCRCVVDHSVSPRRRIGARDSVVSARSWDGVERVGAGETRGDGDERGPSGPGAADYALRPVL